jgi:hypothetical protein
MAFCSYLVHILWQWFIGASLGRMALGFINRPCEWQFQTKIYLIDSQEKRIGKVFFLDLVFLKVYFQHYGQIKLSIPSSLICIPFFFNWIEFKLHAMPFNIFIQMKLNF